VVNSVFSGAANAFLTLRVGIIAKRYCASLVLAERWAIRRAATVEAARMPGGGTGFSKDIRDSLLTLLKVRNSED